jgi:hypothetical protein
VKGDVVPEGGWISHVVYCVKRALVEEALTFWSEGLGAECEPIELEGSGLRRRPTVDDRRAVRGVLPDDSSENRWRLVGVKKVSASMSSAASGSIVNVSSPSGLRGNAGHTSYGTSKWVLRGLTKTPAQDLGSLGIRTLNEINHVSKELTVKRWPCYRMCK